MSHDVTVGILLVVTLVLSVAFLGYCLRHSEKRGAVSLAVMFVGIACWVLADTIHVLVVDTAGDPMAGGGLPIRVLGIELTAIGMLLLGLSYTGREHLISLTTISLLLIKPVLMLGIVLSPMRERMFATVPADVPLGYEITVTPLFLGHITYSYGVAVAGAFLLGTLMLRSPSRYRLQSIALFVAVAVPLSVSLLFQVGIIPYDVTPVSFVASALVLTVGVFRLRLLDTIPLARKRVLDEMDDMVVVVDEPGSVVMCNAAAADLFGSREALVGTPVTDLFDQTSLGELQSDGQTEVVIERADERRLLSVTRSAGADRTNGGSGSVLVCRDITGERRRTEQLRRREQELQLLKDLQSRFLRHNLRNELNVVRANAQLLARGGEEGSPEAYEELIDKTDRLVEWSEKARSIERLIDADETVACAVNERVTDLLAEARATHPEVRFEHSLADGLRVDAVPQFELALENLIDNAARYNTGADPVVRVVTEADGDRAAVRVEDNGPGIDPAVVEAIRRGEPAPLDGSSGIGLWTVYWVVEKSGGDLEFESGPDGTTVELRFGRAGADYGTD